MSSSSETPELVEWLGWTSGEVRAWISSNREPVVMGWPYNGTRRWYQAETRGDPNPEDYLELLTRRQALHHKMAFDNGVSVLLAPSFGRENLKRGEEYVHYALSGLVRLAEDEIYREMISSGLKIKFYGDYAEELSGRSYASVLEDLEEVSRRSAGGDGPLLLFGLFADDAWSRVSTLAVEHLRRTGESPTREDLITAYYGEHIPDLGLFVGFAQPQLFDAPLISTGLESLYATLNPSPSVTERQLREILYDHLISRRSFVEDYSRMSEEAEMRLAESLQRYGGQTIGVGAVDSLTGLWEPGPAGTNSP